MLIGAESYQIGLLGSILFVGWLISCLAVPRVGDKYGRKIPILGSLIISIPAFLGLILSKNL